MTHTLNGKKCHKKLSKNNNNPIIWQVLDANENEVYLISYSSTKRKGIIMVSMSNFSKNWTLA